MKKLKKQIIVPLANLRNKNNSNSNLETQCQFGEIITVINEKDGWYQVKCDLDNYIGWLKKKSVSEITLPSHMIIDKSILVYSEPKLDSKKVFNLYCGAKIKLKTFNNDWVALLKNDFKIGYISKKSKFLAIKKKEKQWIKFAKMFLNSPYQLGGKTMLGIDCSGLVQLVLEICGIAIPRNTSDQIKYESNSITNTSKISKGCLIFWNGHVGLTLTKSQLIHSNATHMKVSIENFDKVNARIEEEYGSIIAIKKINF